MALTILVEVLLLLRLAFWRKPTVASVLGVLILFALAVFQAAEYGICEGLFDVHPNVLARIGFVSITTLPILVLHLVKTIGKSKRNLLIIAAYATMFAWIAIFLFSDALVNQICGGNYIIFELSPGFGGSYFIYYYLWMMVGAIWALNLASKSPSKATASSLRWLVAGVASFAVPATIIWLFWEEAAKGLPSIMCGFAVIFAFIVYVKVTPRS